MQTRSPSYALDAYFDRVREEEEKLIWTARSYALRIPQVPRSTALEVMVTSKAIYLTFRRRFRRQSVRLPLDDIELQKIYPGILMSRWMIRTSRGDWLLNIYRPLTQTLPVDLKGMVALDEKLQPVL